MVGDAAHYFEEEPSAPSEPRTVELVLADLTVSLASDSGVFAADRVDTGTRYLLLEAPTPLTSARNVLDLGCGYGPIARTLAQRAPNAHVWAVDVNSRARALAAANLDGLRATVGAPNQIPDHIKFDLIWSNPPIRIGKPALHELLTKWLGRLAPEGTAVLVVQKHLGADSLARWLADQGWATSRLGSRQGYRLLLVNAQ